MIQEEKSMFWKKKSSEDTVIESGPRIPPVIVQQDLITAKKMDPDFAPLLKAVTRKNGAAGSYIRLYDESDATARKIVVKNYSSLDEYPELVIYEGLFDEGAKKVELAEKNSFNWNANIYSEADVLKKIEELTQPGSSVFFFQARGPTLGGPLGKGASLVEINASYPGKGQHKYNIYSVDIIDLKPANKGEKLWGSDKPKEIAKWVIQGHHKRLYS
jgi:hypothetical protein